MRTGSGRSFLSGGQVRPESTVSPEVAAQTASRVEPLRRRRQAVETREAAVSQKEQEINAIITADTKALAEREDVVFNRETAINTGAYRKEEIEALGAREQALQRREFAVAQRETNIQQKTDETQELRDREAQIRRREEEVVSLEAELGDVYGGQSSFRNMVRRFLSRGRPEEK